MKRSAPYALALALVLTLAVGLAPAQGAVDGLPDYLGWVRLNPQKNFITSAHPTAKDVYVDAVGTDAALTRSFPFPDGSVLIKESIDPEARSVVVVTAMRKVAGFDPANGDWQYAMFERMDDGSFGGGWIDAGTDMHSMCVTCHTAAAANDYAFLTYAGE